MSPLKLGHVGRMLTAHRDLDFFFILSIVYLPLEQMGELYKQNGQQLYSEDFVAADNTGLENKILKNE